MPPQPVIFPVKGLHKTSGFDLQPPGTTSDLLNVRAHDPIEGRLRGGRRAGLSKWYDSALSTNKSVQAMTKVVRAADYSSASQDYIGVGHYDQGDDVTFREYDIDGVALFTYDTGNRSNGYAKDIQGNYYFCTSRNVDWAGGDGLTYASLIKVDAGGNVLWTFDSGGTSSHRLAYDPATDKVILSSQYRQNDWEGSTGSDDYKIAWALNGQTGEVLWSLAENYNAHTLRRLHRIRVDSDSNIFFCGRTGTLDTVNPSANNSVWKYDTEGGFLGGYKTGSAAYDLSISDSNTILVMQDYAGASWTGYDGNNRNVFILPNDLSTPTYAYDINSRPHPGDSGYAKCAWASGGNFVILGGCTSADTNTVKLINYSTAATIWGFYGKSSSSGPYLYGVRVSSTGVVTVVGERTSNWPGTTGTASVWNLDAATGAVLWHKDIVSSPYDWCIFAEAEILTDITSNTKEVSLVTVAGGDVKLLRGGVLYAVTSGASAMSQYYGRLAITSGFDMVFMVDGTNSKYLDLSDNTMKDWATNVTPLPADFPANARLIALYRGRVVLSGVKTDSHNWYMSKVGDPFDFDYSPATTSAIQAVAGNNAPAGLVGDIITTLIPFSDDVMIMGGDQTIWQMTGDPAAGGAIDLITDKTGMAFGRSWAKDPTNRLYFMGVDGIYSMYVGEQPVNMTDTRLAKEFEDIDLTTDRVLLEWDTQRRGLYVIVYPTTDGILDIVTVYFWDARVDGWFKDSYPLAMGPSALYAYDAEGAEDRAMLFGCRDSYIRQVDTDANDDDGTSITNYARCTPLQIGDGVTQAKLNEINISLAKSSGNVDLKIYGGQTAQQCQESSAVRFKRTVKAGHNPVTRPRISGNTLQIELGQTAASARWALENMSVGLVPSGRTRKGA